LPATAFVAFLQNHDAVGTFGTRLSTRAADPALHASIAIVLLSPQIPLLFMGEEWGSGQPFLFFCDFEPGLETRCARAGAGNLPISQNSEMMPPAKRSPTRP